MTTNPHKGSSLRSLFEELDEWNEVEALAQRKKVDPDAAFTIDVVSAPDQIPRETQVVCVDVATLGVLWAIDWLEVHGPSIRARGAFLIAAVGGGAGGDLSKLVGSVDGITGHPRSRSLRAWIEHVAPLVASLRDPEREDALPPGDVHGGVSAEEFAETLAQAALPDADPRKRD